MKVPSCSVCANTYNEEERAPLMLNCGHSFCKECMAHMFQSVTDHTLSCPRCRQKSKVGNSVEALRKNFSMIALIQQAASSSPTEGTDSDENMNELVYNSIQPSTIASLITSSNRPSKCSDSSFDLNTHNLRLKKLIATRSKPHHDIWIAILSGPYGCKHKVVVKRLEVPSCVDFIKVKQKFDSLRRCASWCQNVCHIYGVMEKDGKICIIMEKYAGSVKEAMDKNGGRLTLEQILRYGADIARGASELHASGILCMNMKLSNLLLDKKGRVAVSNYSLPELWNIMNTEKSDLFREHFKTFASMMSLSSKSMNCVEQYMLYPNYLAPEILEQCKKGSLFSTDSSAFSKESDAWSFGCVLVEMCTGIVPWSDSNPEEIYKLAVKAKKQPPQYSNLIGGGIPRDVWKMIGDCLQCKPNKRPSFHSMLTVFLQHLKQIHLSPPPSPENSYSKNSQDDPSPTSSLEFDSKTGSKLHLLIDEGDLQSIKALFLQASVLKQPDYLLSTSSNSNPNVPTVGSLLESRNEEGQTPLHMASMRGHDQILEFLLSFPEADVESLDKEGHTPPFFAVAAAAPKCLKLLIQRGSDVNFKLKEGFGPSLAHVCAYHGHPECMQELLSSGADANDVDDEGETVLHSAIIKSHTECAKVIIRNGGSKSMSTRNAKNLTPLHMCINSGFVDVIQEWLSVENDENEITKALNKKCDVGNSIILATSMKSKLKKESREIVKVLLQYKFDLYEYDLTNGNTCLHNAVIANDCELIQTILDSEFDINVKNKSGFTPLQVALFNGLNDVVKLLLKYNADVNIKNMKGDNALHIAAFTCNSIRENLQWLNIMLNMNGSNYHEKNEDGKSVKEFLEALPREWIPEELLITLEKLKIRLSPCTFQIGDWVTFNSTFDISKFTRKPSNICATSIGFVQSFSKNGNIVLSVCSEEIVVSCDYIRLVMPFKIGQKVCIKSSVEKPKFGWRGQSHDSVGTILCVDDDGILRIGFPGAMRGWKADPADLNRVETFKVGDFVKVRQTLGLSKIRSDSVAHGSIGVVRSIRPDYCLMIKFNFLENLWLCEPEEVEFVEPFQVGDKICVKRSVAEPRYAWGSETHHSVGTISDVNNDGLLMISISNRPYLWQADPADVEKLDEIKVGDWVQIKPSIPAPKYGWEDVTRGSVGVVYALDGDGDVWIGFCFRSKPFDCSLADVEKMERFEIGQTVKLLSSVSEPKLGWYGETNISSGKISNIDMDGTLHLSIPGRSTLWKVSPGDVEKMSDFQVGDWVKLKSKPSQLSPFRLSFPSSATFLPGNLDDGLAACSSSSLNQTSCCTSEFVAVVHSMSDAGFLQLMACYTPFRWSVHCTEVEKISPLKVGQIVRFKSTISEPRWGWRGASKQSSGMIVSVHTNGEVKVCFSNMNGGTSLWKADPSDLELENDFEVWDWVKVKSDLDAPYFNGLDHGSASGSGVKPGGVGVIQSIICAPEVDDLIHELDSLKKKEIQHLTIHSSSSSASSYSHPSPSPSVLSPAFLKDEYYVSLLSSKSSSSDSDTEPRRLNSGSRLDQKKLISQKKSKIKEKTTKRSLSSLSTSSNAKPKPRLSAKYDNDDEDELDEVATSQQSNGNSEEYESDINNAKVNSDLENRPRQVFSIGFCGSQNQWLGLPDEVEKFEPIQIGQLVRIRPEVSEPKFGWAGLNHDSVVSISAVDSDGMLHAHLPFMKDKIWNLDPSEVEIVKEQEPLKVGDWVKVKNSVLTPTNQWGEVNHKSIGVIHRIDYEGNLWVSFCFMEKLWICRAEEMEKIPPFTIGQMVWIKRSVKKPRWGWGNETYESKGKILIVDADGKLRIRFERREGRLWVGDPADLELVECGR